MVTEIGIKNCVDEEVFVTVVEENGDEYSVEAFDSVEDMNKSLNGMHPELSDEIKAYHGVLTSAKYIPKNINKKITARIIVTNPRDESESIVYGDEEDDVEELAESIETLITDNLQSPYEDITIDEVSILYGYELDLGFNVDLDSLDEESSDKCKKLVEEVNRIEYGVEDVF